MSLIRFAAMHLFQPRVWMITTTLLAVAGCGHTGTVPGRDAGPLDAGAGGMGGAGGSGASGGAVDAGTDGPDFCGQCAPGSALGWDDATLVWIGAEKDAPECPADAPAVVYEGRGDLVAPLDCGTCGCAKPSGACALPATMTANAATCALDGAATPHTPFNPASGWGGACDTNAAIPSGKLCSGVKCVQSLTIGPLSISESGCAPSQPPAQSAPTWGSFARACKAEPRMMCGAGSGTCLAEPPMGAGFRVCMYQDGDQACPDISPYSEKHLFYGGYHDTRACGACTCGAASGSTCAATLSIYTDGACSVLAYATAVDASGATCHDLPPGTPLGSKAAGAATYAPGACAPGGGAPTGSADPIKPATLCCLPP
jgi:hypothetical protein